MRELVAIANLLLTSEHSALNASEVLEEFAKSCDKVKCKAFLSGSLSVLESARVLDPEVVDKVAKLASEGAVEVCPWYVAIEPFAHTGEAILANELMGHVVCNELGIHCSDVIFIESKLGLPPIMPRICRLAGVRAIIASIEGEEPYLEAKWCSGSACITIVSMSKEARLRLAKSVENVVRIPGVSSELRRVDISACLDPCEIGEKLVELVESYRPFMKSKVYPVVIEASPQCLSKVLEACANKGLECKILGLSEYVDVVLGRIESRISKKKWEIPKLFVASEVPRKLGSLWLEKMVFLHLGLVQSIAYISEGLPRPRRIEGLWRKMLLGKESEVLNEVIAEISSTLTRLSGFKKGVSYVNPIPYEVPTLLELPTTKELANKTLVTPWGLAEPIAMSSNGDLVLGVVAKLEPLSIGVAPFEEIPLANVKVKDVRREAMYQLVESIKGFEVIVEVRYEGRNFVMIPKAEYEGQSISWRAYELSLGDAKGSMIVRRYELLDSSMDIELKLSFEADLVLKLRGAKGKLHIYTPWLLMERKFIGDVCKGVVHEYMLIDCGKSHVAIGLRDVHRYEAREDIEGIELSIGLGSGKNSMRIHVDRDLRNCIAIAKSFSVPPIASLLLDGEGRAKEESLSIASTEPPIEVSTIKPWRFGKGVVLRLVNPYKDFEAKVSLADWVKRVCRTTVFEKVVECIELSVGKVGVKLERGGVETLVLTP